MTEERIRSETHYGIWHDVFYMTKKKTKDLLRYMVMNTSDNHIDTLKEDIWIEYSIRTHIESE